jgi:hypothetical protein
MKKIFVGYGYNQRDSWIEELVFPIIEAFRVDVVTGKELQGRSITDGVRDKIKDSDAVIGFTTRRDKIAKTKNQWTTHQWVRDELLFAKSLNVPIVEVREDGVQEQDGLLGGLQRILYRENQRENFLVELVKLIGQWHEGKPVTMQLLPEEIALEIWTLLKDADLSCTYHFLVKNRETKKVPVDIHKIDQGLFIQADNVPNDSLVRVQIKHGSKAWESPYLKSDSINVKLERR